MLLPNWHIAFSSLAPRRAEENMAAAPINFGWHTGEPTKIRLAALPNFSG